MPWERQNGKHVPSAGAGRRREKHDAEVPHFDCQVHGSNRDRGVGYLRPEGRNEVLGERLFTLARRDADRSDPERYLLSGSSAGGLGGFSSVRLGLPRLDLRSVVERRPTTTTPDEFSVERLHERIHRLPEYIPNPRYKGNRNFFSGNLSFGEPPEILKPGIAFWEGDRESYNHVGHSLGVLLFGLVGAAWARLAFRRRDGSATEGSNSIGDSVSPPLAR